MVATDINNDGWMDLFVANDTVQNFLYVNRGPSKERADGGNSRRSPFRRRLPSATAASRAPAWA